MSGELANLTTAPAWLIDAARSGEWAAEGVTGYMPVSAPDGPGRWKVAGWRIITRTGMYDLDPETHLCTRARAVHPFPDGDR